MNAEKWLAGALRIAGALIVAGIAMLPAYAGAWAACHDGSAWCGTSPDLKAAFGYLGVAGTLMGLAVAVGMGGARLRVLAVLLLGGFAAGLGLAALLVR